MRLEGKVAIVTGGAKGLGGEMAQTFAREGAKVIAADMMPLTYECENVEFYQLNVTDGEACKGLFEYAKEKFGKIDILVNNAGITRDAMTRKMTDEQWDLVVDINLKGIFNLVRYVGPFMEEIGGGSIINMSSVVGVSGNAGQCNYSASKAGLIGLSKSIAKEMGPRGVRSNCIAPGFIETDMTGALPEDIRKDWEKQIPMRRAGKPEDVADVALFLASDLAGYVTGQVINCCGGMNC